MLLTGCASGIGRHLVGALSRAGHRVWATDVHLEALQRAASDDGWDRTRVELVRLDVRDPAAWSAVLDQIESREGPLDVLMNIAGVVLPGWVHESRPEAVRLHMEVNTHGVLFGTQAAASRMVARGRGHIVNIASLAGIAPVPGLALYTASKFAVRGFSLAVAQELRHHGVAVTVICPDAVATPMVDLQVDFPEAALTFSGSRMLSVDEISQAVLTRALPHRPLELILPRSRGWMAKLTSLWPSLTYRLLPTLRRAGRGRQEALQRQRQASQKSSEKSSRSEA